MRRIIFKISVALILIMLAAALVLDRVLAEESMAAQSWNPVNGWFIACAIRLGCTNG